MHSLHPFSRRRLLALGAGAALTAAARAASAKELPPTDFQIGCMTYVYRDFPLQRALEGIARSGYRYVAWGTEHQEEPGRRVPVIAKDAPAEAARRLAARCRGLGLEPVMMFSMVYPEHRDAVEVFKRRIEQAHAAGMPQVLTFGHTENGARPVWMERFRTLAPIAQEAGVTLVIKQHGGETGTGEACARITRELAHPHVKVNFDAGNVMDYLDVDPIPDLRRCADEVRSFCIKDHRNFPKDQDCGPGFGEIDHYRLLAAVAHTGRKLPLCCENISAPLLPPARTPEEVDALARRAREFLELVTRGLHAAGPLEPQ
ncbi:MAG: sugar phosphate isomerase/epimerase family protein [Armatimonadota bacterium]